MRILIVSFFFPPYNSIGAVRVGKTVKYLLKMGHEVRVVSAESQPCPMSLKMECPSEIVSFTTWTDYRKYFSRNVEKKNGGGSVHPQNGYLKKWIWKVIRAFLYYPDMCAGWYKSAVLIGDEISRNWKPEVIYASAMPFTGFMIASELSRRHHIPWIAEFRDLWVDNHAYEYPIWRKIIEQRLEKKVVDTAAALVTVSAPLADTLRRKYSKPVSVITNGFDLDDYEVEIRPPASDVLRIIYTGVIYEGKQDVKPLFMAIGRNINILSRIKIVFYCPAINEHYISSMAKLYRVDSAVEIKQPISHSAALLEQRTADVLLLLLWNDPKERGVFTGKLFEYLGARRPILAIGNTENVASELLTKRKAGAVTNDVSQIETVLDSWLSQKQSSGELPPLSLDVRAGYSREEQTSQLADFISNIISNHQAGACTEKDHL